MRKQGRYIFNKGCYAVLLIVSFFLVRTLVKDPSHTVYRLFTVCLLVCLFVSFLAITNFILQINTHERFDSKKLYWLLDFTNASIKYPGFDPARGN